MGRVRCLVNVVARGRTVAVPLPTFLLRSQRGRWVVLGRPERALCKRARALPVVIGNVFGLCSVRGPGLPAEDHKPVPFVEPEAEDVSADIHPRLGPFCLHDSHVSSHAQPPYGRCQLAFYSFTNEYGKPPGIPAIIVVL